MTDRPAAVVIAKAPRPGLCKTRLEPLLGPEGCARLQAALIERAAAWAASVGDAYVVFTPEDAREEVAALAPGATLIPQVDGSLGDRLAGAFRAVLADRDPPTPAVLVGVDTPQLGARHAAAALDDLADGIDVTLGPASDGGYYLIGLREAHDAVFALPAAKWGGPDVMRLDAGGGGRRRPVDRDAPRRARPRRGGRRAGPARRPAHPARDRRRTPLAGLVGCQHMVHRPPTSGVPGAFVPP